MRVIFLLTAVLFFNTAFAQTGKIEGKVTDANTGLALSGVSVVEKSSGKGVATNTEGRYIINVEGKIISLVFSYNGVTQQIDGIEITEGKVTTQDLAITPKTKTEEAVVVRAASTARKETAAAIISFQKNTNTVASVISAESIRRSPDRNTGEVLKRTPGASLIDGKFLVIRGLADRYNQAMLNGILLTSTEPDRKTFSFDIIPAPMINNIVINKAFVPELPGEWAGGLIQVNTKDIPSKNFFNIQIGTGFNTQTIGKDFYKAEGGKLDWLGIEDGTRALPDNYSTKSGFNLATQEEKNAIGKALNNNWAPKVSKASPNMALQLNGGFTGKLFGKKLGGIFGINYSKTNAYTDILNQGQVLNSGVFSQQFSYNDDRYTQAVALGGLASLTLQLNTNNKISVKSIINVNTNNYTIQREGVNKQTFDDVYGGESGFKENTFFTTQLNGEHTVTKAVKFKWYGAFNILDGYSPDQRRYQYTRPTGTQNTYEFLVGASNAQESGSRVFQTLSDYIYTAGGDVSYSYELFKQKQTVKGGYMLQIKDRLYDAQLFANQFNAGFNNATLRRLPIDKIFAPENFGNGNDDLFSFKSINNRDFRYMANTILNAGFVQFDNQFSRKIRIVWGLRVEHFDQLLGTVKQWDLTRHKHTKQIDYLPGLNATYKLSNKTNIRLSASQTVIRPEQRELASLTLYDFELNSAVMGNPNLERTKVSNLDLRYELYPRSGEVFTAGVFYKFFKKPIEQNLQQGGAIFEFQNPEEARAFGAEVEIRKKLDMADALKNFTIQANAAYINSEVKDTKREIKRSLQGQSPYLLNLGIMYDLQKAGLNATLLFNQIGRRIYLVGDIPAGGGDGAPDVWEAPRAVLDFQLGKKVIQEKGEIRLNVSNLLNTTQYFYQNKEDGSSFDKGKDAYRFTRKFGSTVSVTFNYSL